MITRKQCPFQPPTPPWAPVRLRVDHVSDGATTSFLLPIVCCNGLIPANPLFSSVHPTHTHTAASLNWDTTTCRVNERSRSKEYKLLCRYSKDCHQGESISSNPRSVIKTELCTAEGNDAFSHKAVFSMSVCDLLRVIGSLQRRAEVLGRSWSSGGAAGRWETSDWTDACLVLLEAEKHASKHVWRELCVEKTLWGHIIFITVLMVYNNNNVYFTCV